MSTRPAKNDPSLMRNLGAFFGEIVKAVKTDPAAPAPNKSQIASTEDHRPVQTPLGPGIASTRTIDEIQVEPAKPGKPARLTARRSTTQELRIDLPASECKP